MSDTVQITLITIVGGGILALLTAWVKNLSDRAGLNETVRKADRTELLIQIASAGSRMDELEAKNDRQRLAHEKERMDWEQERVGWRKRVRDLESEVEGVRSEIAIMRRTNLDTRANTTALNNLARVTQDNISGREAGQSIMQDNTDKTVTNSEVVEANTQARKKENGNGS